MRMIKKLVILILFIIVIMAACFRIDRPENGIGKKDESFQTLKVSSKYKEPENVTINGVDYLQSNSPIGTFGGNIVTSIIGEGPKTFNPWVSKDATSSQIADMMFDSLVTTDAVSGQVIPKMAKKIKVSSDNMTYIITLRKGLKWSDGKDITAEDVVFTWNDIILGGFGNTSTRDSILVDGQEPTISKIDNYTIKFTTPKPFAPFLRLLATPIAPEHILKPVLKKGKRYFDSYWSSNTKPTEFVTSGAFKLHEYVPAQRVVMKRNPNYYVINSKKQKLPYIEKYIFLIVGDLNNEILKFEAKELDVIGIRGKDASRFKELEKKSDYTVYNLGPDTGTMFITFNLNKRKNQSGKYYVPKYKQAWFNDINFRTAVDYAIDRESLVANIANGVGQPLFTAEALSSIFINEKLKKGHIRDIKYAKELLKKSGFSWDKNGILHDKTGKEVEIDLLTNAGNTEREAIGVMLKQDLQDIGIKINFKPVEFNSLVNKITNSLDWDCVIIGFTGSALEPHSGKNVWYSYGPLHLFNKRLSDEKIQDIEPWEIQLDNIFNQAALKLNFKERKKLYDQYQQIVYDYKPIIYLYSPLRIVALRNKFGNIYPSQLEGLLHNPEEIYIKKDNNKL